MFIILVLWRWKRSSCFVGTENFHSFSTTRRGRNIHSFRTSRLVHIFEYRPSLHRLVPSEKVLVKTFQWNRHRHSGIPLRSLCDCCCSIYLHYSGKFHLVKKVVFADSLIWVFILVYQHQTPLLMVIKRDQENCTQKRDKKVHLHD